MSTDGLPSTAQVAKWLSSVTVRFGFVIM